MFRGLSRSELKSPKCNAHQGRTHETGRAGIARPGHWIVDIVHLACLLSLDFLAPFKANLALDVQGLFVVAYRTIPAVSRLGIAVRIVRG